MTEEELFVPTRVFWTAVHWLKHDRPYILIILGPPGTGKSTIARSLIKRFPEYPNLWITPTSGTDLEALLGTYILVKQETRFVDGELKKALLTKDTLIILDDAHCVAKSTQRFNGLGDEGRQISTGEQQTFTVAEGVKLILLVNPVPGDTPPWTKTELEIPEQIRSRSRFLRLDRSGGLRPEEERAIALKHWPRSQPEDVLNGILEVFHHLRTNGTLRSYSPSLRDTVTIGQLLSQGVPLGASFLEVVANKYLDDTEHLAAKEAFRAKFNIDPEVNAWNYGYSFAEAEGLLVKAGEEKVR